MAFFLLRGICKFHVRLMGKAMTIHVHVSYYCEHSSAKSRRGTDS
jgi:hypothetical protein